MPLHFDAVPARRRRGDANIHLKSLKFSDTRGTAIAIEPRRPRGRAAVVGAPCPCAPSTRIRGPAHRAGRRDARDGHLRPRRAAPAHAARAPGRRCTSFDVQTRPARATAYRENHHDEGRGPPPPQESRPGGAGQIRRGVFLRVRAVGARRGLRVSWMARKGKARSPGSFMPAVEKGRFARRWPPGVIAGLSRRGPEGHRPRRQRATASTAKENRVSSPRRRAKADVRWRSWRARPHSCSKPIVEGDRGITAPADRGWATSPATSPRARGQVERHRSASSAAG